MSPWSDLQPRHGSTGWTRLDAPLALITMIAASPAACFDLSLNVHAHTASMGPSGERAVAGVTAGLLSGSDTVTWEARHFGIPFRMTSKVDEFERPLRFVDYQVGGAVWSLVARAPLRGCARRRYVHARPRHRIPVTARADRRSSTSGSCVATCTAFSRNAMPGSRRTGSLGIGAPAAVPLSCQAAGSTPVVLTTGSAAAGGRSPGRRTRELNEGRSRRR